MYQSSTLVVFICQLIAIGRLRLGTYYCSPQADGPYPYCRDIQVVKYHHTATFRPSSADSVTDRQKLQKTLLNPLIVNVGSRLQSQGALYSRT